MDELDAWLGTSLGPENLRAEVRNAGGGSMEDLRSCELEDLESELSLSTWPLIEQQRFLSAWRGLRGENDVDDADDRLHLSPTAISTFPATQLLRRPL